MSIPIRTVSSANITIGATFPARAGFGTLNIVTAEDGPISIAERIRYYSSIDALTADWDANSEVVKAATSYYGQKPSPINLRVSMRYPTAQSSQLRGGSVTDVAPFLAISDGSFTISIDGDSQNITGMDFSDGETTLVNVASTIQSALQAVATGGFTSATCTYEDGRFYINSGTTGTSSTVSFLTPVSPATGTDISSLLQMMQGEGTKTDGIAAETISQSLSSINNIESDWYGFMFTKEVRDSVQINGEDAVLAAAAWAQARVKVFLNTTNDLDSYDSVTTNDIGSQLQAGNYSRTITSFSSYPNQYPSASVAGRAFTVNFDLPNSTITLKFKQLPGITVESLTSGQYEVLKSKNINAFIDVGGNSMYAESKMADGKFFDEIHGVDWLQNAIETDQFGTLFTSPTKVAYTDKDITKLIQALTRNLDEARRNGLIAPGTTLDGEFLAAGYKITAIAVAEVSPSNKANRQYNGLSFVCIGAGSIHGVQVDGVFER